MLWRILHSYSGFLINFAVGGKSNETDGKRADNHFSYYLNNLIKIATKVGRIFMSSKQRSSPAAASENPAPGSSRPYCGWPYCFVLLTDH